MTSGHRGKVRWEAEAHTLAKHRILRHYLHAWFPILARYHSKIVYIDGFAGPGSYIRGEEGSPLIALRALLEHQHIAQISKAHQYRFVFIEKEPERAEYLEAELAIFGSSINWPENVKFEVVTGEFAVEIGGVLDRLENEGFGSAPRFTFVDPFGYAGTPMRVIKRLVETPRSEVLIFFPYPSIERFAGYLPQEEHFNELFASSTVWRRPLQESDPDRKRSGFVEAYERRLKEFTSLAHVWKFELIDKGEDHFFLIFATNSEDGLSEMKVAGWSVDKFSGVAYKAPASQAQQFLFEAVADVSQLREELRQHFQNKGWVDIVEVASFVLTQTVFSEQLHLKDRTLRPMELSNPHLIEARGKVGRRRGDYPAGTKLRFLTDDEISPTLFSYFLGEFLPPATGGGLPPSLGV